MRITVLQSGPDDTLLTALRQAGHQVTAVDAPELSHERIAALRGDLVIYHCPSPEALDSDFMTAVRATIDAPILVLGAEEDVEFAVRALRLGADDCLCGSSSSRELIARVEAARRRYRDWRGASFPEQVPFIDSATQSAYVSGKQVELTNAEFSVMRYLVEHRGQVVKREDLCRVVWGVEPGEKISTGLSVLLHKLRRKLERDPHRPELILTKRGAGYFLAKLVRLV